MKSITCLFLTALFTITTNMLFAQKVFTLESPQKSTIITISVGEQITYQVTHEGDIITEASPISLTFDNGKSWGLNSKVLRKATTEVNDVIKTPIYKKSEVKNIYNELTLKFKGDFNLIFRSYDDAIAYRFESTKDQQLNVISEQATFNFPQDHKSYIPYVKKITHDTRGADIGTMEKQFWNSFENKYVYSNLSEWEDGRFAFLPILFEKENGKKISITEVDLFDYPGMYLTKNKDNANSLIGVFAPYPKKIVQGGYNMLEEVVTEKEPYIAKLNGITKLPWRTIIIANEDKDLVNNDMVYKLAKPSHGDYSWVKPGKVAWDWWNDWSLYNVDFKAGINNETYKYYIDFASRNGIEYVILDEGWTKLLTADLMQVIPEIDIKELVAYAEKRNVGIILWAGYYALARDIEGICKHYAAQGIKGFKVDFMNRDDQLMIDFHHKTAQIAAKYKLMIDFHGTYKPTGLQCTYPNVINVEGVDGLEQLKFADTDQVLYDVTIPFIRQIAGPMDYTQGAMKNASKKSFSVVYSEPMSQGTRCRQLAQYVIFESPLNMLCDSPSNYEAEKESLEFISKIPTVWDETVALNGKVAEYISVARRSKDVWYVGSMTNWTAREIELDLSFLGDGEFVAEIFTDGLNAAKVAKDYKKESIKIPSNKKIKVFLAPGGGSALKISKL